MHRSFLLSLLVIATLFVPLKTSFAIEAPVVAPQPCDPQFYKQMTARAWLEAEREIMQNQNLIFKADSILDYTCFDQFTNKANAEGGAIFTHTEYFDGQIIPRGEPFSLDQTLTNIVLATYTSYRGENFDHDLLGGRGEFLDLPRTEILEALTPANESEDYACDVMARVWSTAKCLNFVHNERFARTDGFYPFEVIACAEGIEGCEPVAGYQDTYIDTRHWPEACLTEAQLDDAALWEENLIEAENEDQALYLFQEPLGEIFRDVFELTRTGVCHDGIPTGVTVVTSEGPAHEDGVCTNPGCSYTASGSCSGGGGGGGAGPGGNGGV